MSFQAKRLRVQLPCDGDSVFEAADCPMDTRCNGVSFFCAPDTCSFGEHSRIGPGGLCDINTCVFQSPGLCPGFPSEPGFEPTAMVFDASELPRLRQALEAQLEEVRKAEKALKDRGSTQ